MTKHQTIFNLLKENVAKASPRALLSLAVYTFNIPMNYFASAGEYLCKIYIDLDTTARKQNKSRKFC